MSTLWQRVIQRSTAIGSVLCTIECTLLPILSVASAGMEGATASQTLHHFAHAATWYFVAPFGTYSVIRNYSLHRNVPTTVVGTAGLAAILGSHSHFMMDHVFSGLPESARTAASLLGCAAFVGSQWHSSRLINETGKVCCHSSVSDADAKRS
eukprot:ANDGO_03201.mRNA.1 hypothetical protein